MSDALRPNTAAIVVAAGKGLRAGQPLPKQFARWRGKPLVRHSVEAFARLGIAPIVVVIPEGAETVTSQCLEGIKGVRLVTGDETRQGSVLRGLSALANSPPDLVLIHDAARPVVPDEVVYRLLQALTESPAAIPVLPVADSILTATDGRMEGAVDRDRLRRVQTPQAFRFGDILAAHRRWADAPNAGDDAQVANAAGIEVALVEGDEALHKLTYSGDFDEDRAPVRIGSGYDVHRLAKGEELWLCGIRIDHDQGLAGHSDADVAIHALVDAILGAAGMGDIGQHFPPSDAQWKGASSDQFLRHAVRLASQTGYRIGNADITIICEAPKIGPHRDAMRDRLAELMEIDTGAVNVKATTTEGLGLTGRREGIAAQASVSLLRN